VNTAGYFNSVAALLKVGDLIFCYTSTGGTPAMSIVYVNANSGTVVDVTDGLTVTATDSD
jgi:cell wall-associated NlpC family hydrolase